MNKNMKEAPEFVSQEQLNEIINKIIADDNFIESVLARIVAKMNSAMKKRN